MWPLASLCLLFSWETSSIKPVICREGELVLKQWSWWFRGRCPMLGAGGLAKLHVFETFLTSTCTAKGRRAPAALLVFGSVYGTWEDPRFSWDYALIFSSWWILNVGNFSHLFLYLCLKQLLWEGKKRHIYWLHNFFEVATQVLKG